MEPIFYVKGIKWPSDIRGEGKPTGWYARATNALPSDGEYFRDLDKPCPFTSGRYDYRYIDGVLYYNVVLFVAVFYTTDRGYSGWLDDSPWIPNVVDGSTITFEAYSNYCTNWQVQPPEIPISITDFEIINFEKV